MIFYLLIFHTLYSDTSGTSSDFSQESVKSPVFKSIDQRLRDLEERNDIVEDLNALLNGNIEMVLLHQKPSCGLIEKALWNLQKSNYHRNKWERNTELYTKILTQSQKFEKERFAFDKAQKEALLKLQKILIEMQRNLERFRLDGEEEFLRQMQTLQRENIFSAIQIGDLKSEIALLNRKLRESKETLKDERSLGNKGANELQKEVLKKNQEIEKLRGTLQDTFKDNQLLQEKVVKLSKKKLYIEYKDLKSRMDISEIENAKTQEENSRLKEKIRALEALELERMTTRTNQAGLSSRDTSFASIDEVLRQMSARTRFGSEGSF